MYTRELQEDLLLEETIASSTAKDRQDIGLFEFIQVRHDGNHLWHSILRQGQRIPLALWCLVERNQEHFNRTVDLLRLSHVQF